MWSQSLSEYRHPPRIMRQTKNGWGVQRQAHGPTWRIVGCDTPEFSSRRRKVSLKEKRLALLAAERLQDHDFPPPGKRCGRLLGESRPRRTRSGDGEGGDVTGPQTPVVAFSVRATRRW